MSFITRYSDLKRGGIIFTGNTLGLSKAANVNQAGLIGSIGAFTSLNTALQVDGFPSGTTLMYQQNGSRGILNLPASSQILYAELIWGGLYRSSDRDISAIIDSPVTFDTPTGSHQISGDIATRQNFLLPSSGTFELGIYVRSANVTGLIQSAPTAIYSLNAVPALIETIDAKTSETNHAGWTLAVVYENDNEPLRNLTLWIGGEPVYPENDTVDVSLSGFTTPDALPVTGKLHLSAQEGDAVLSGDSVYFGESAQTLQRLDGANNPPTNFFASQINNSDGNLDTSGTFGTRNANAYAGANTLACRQGWDITAIDITNILTAAQSTALVRFTTDGDLYIPNALALQIDSKGASITAVKSSDKSAAMVGEEILYTISLTNTGDIQATDVIVSDLLPDGLQLVTGSITIDGTPYAGTLPVQLTSIQPDQSVTIRFRAAANAIPNINPTPNQATVRYSYSPFAGEIRTDTVETNTVRVLIQEPARTSVDIVKTADKAYANIGDNIIYTTTVTNTGSSTVSELYFRDTLPIGTQLIPGSVTIDGVPYPTFDPAIGFALRELSAGESHTVTFAADTTFARGTVYNQSKVTFTGAETQDIAFSNVVSTLLLPNRRYSRRCNIIIIDDSCHCDCCQYHGTCYTC